jgi:iron complex outermembrane receptor protein
MPAWAQESIENYLDMPLEDLLSMQVTSVSKKKQRLNEAAAAIFVITQEDIRRSGATSIPEALRMAPGIQVAKIDANKWAISSRGFNTQFVNKLLVLIDGRTVYTPAYSGVYWEVQDTLLEDVDRIEVIRGPGATLWGANAVNGVINIITKQAKDTQGGLLVAGSGNEERAIASLRYGAQLNDKAQGRAYLKYNNRDSSYYPALDDDAGDEWENLRGGFRLDTQLTENDNWTLQGDVYEVKANQLLNLWQDPSDPANAVYAPYYLATNLPDRVKSTGWNLLTRWDRLLSEDSNIRLQVYYDHTRRAEIFNVQTHDTLDFDFQHQFKVLDVHDVVWGLGYRRVQDDFDNTFNVNFIPDRQSSELISAFIQDEIQLVPNRLHLTLGSKFEHNDYSGFEIQPSVRLVWLPTERSTVWASVSRAVRTPSRLETGSHIVARIIPIPPTYFPMTLYTVGNEDLESEKLMAYEAGYRIQPRENLSFDLALFYNDYDKLQNFERTPLPTEQLFDNKLTARTSGLEVVIDWRPQEWWRLQTSYSHIHIISDLDNDSTDPIGADSVVEGSTPRHQLSLRSMMDVSRQVSLDLWVYYMDELQRTSWSVPISIPEYTSFNARLAWRPNDALEFSLNGHNLLDNHHREFVGENLLIQAEVERSIYGQVRWDF